MDPCRGNGCLGGCCGDAGGSWSDVYDAPCPIWVYRPPETADLVVDDAHVVDGGARGFLVANKPTGLLTAPGIGPDKADCLLSRLAERYPSAEKLSVVHRLDTHTSGLVVLALDADAHRALSRLFADRRVSKTYTALLEGHMRGDIGCTGVVDVPLRKDMDRVPAQLVDWDKGKPCLTRWQLLAREALPGGRTASRVRFFPETGRTHQLRIHAAHPAVREVGQRGGVGLARPIVGDDMYNSMCTLAPRLMLHADTLAFPHPPSAEPLSFSCPPPF